MGKEKQRFKVKIEGKEAGVVAAAGESDAGFEDGSEVDGLANPHLCRKERGKDGAPSEDAMGKEKLRGSLMAAAKAGTDFCGTCGTPSASLRAGC